MGEQKRRTEQQTAYVEAMQALTRKLTDEGCLIEAGWVGLRTMWLMPDTPDYQVDALRMAFMAGAQHTFTSFLTMLDPGEDPTDADMARMDKIQAELDAFEKELRRGLPTSGNA